MIHMTLSNGSYNCIVFHKITVRTGNKGEEVINESAKQGINNLKYKKIIYMHLYLLT